ncbi:MAG TPA: AsmA-like C-terminal region-containing protein [Candidatus Omnitrophota bacterium]|nr:AsmA-like C-terminal region-containing protein [Candidatus Omnitrophota bacterium]HRY85068.1 AsmA-like C-terminal region-containing protein [Candidatus Omnitrophota bacterium]
MKKRQAFLLVAVLLLILFVSGLSVQSHRLLPSPKLHELLAQKIQAFTDGALKYQSVQVGYFPQPKIIFERPQLVFSDRPFSIEAERIQLDFNILPLLFGRVEPAAFYAQSGKAELSLPGLGPLNPLRFENFSLQIGAVGAKVPIPFRFTSDMGGKPEALVVKGNVVLDSIEQWNWEKTSGYMAIELKGLALETMAKQTGADPQQLSFLKAGQVDTSVEIKKKAQEAFLELTAIGAGKGLSYEIPQDKPWVAPPPLDAEWNVAAAWNNDTTELKLHKATVKLPFGSIEANGSLKAGTGEITNVYVAGSNMALEDLLKYWPGLESALPFHVGFSGPGKWILSTEGTLDHLSLHFAWDLAQVLLSYGQYFSKPKDVPLDLTLDLLLQKGTLLGGDFAVKFKEMSMKGNLKDLDLKSGEGQLNLITNKFSMTGWEQFIPALQRYKLEGDAKLMANWKGDLRKLEKAERIFNATFDKASWITPEGLGIRNASFVLDYSPLMVEGRQMQFEIGGSPVVADLKISELSQKPKVEAKISSGELKILQTWKEIAALFQRKTESAGPDSFDHIGDFIGNLLPENEILRNVLAEVRCENEVWDIPLLQFESYGGKADLQGSLRFKEKEPDYRIEGGFRGLDLGLFLGRRDATQRILEGALDLQGSIQGMGWGSENWNRSLAGQGEFTLTGGKFLTFDLKDALSTIEPFRNLGAFVPAMKDFDSMNFQWRISEGKVTTDNLLVKHGDYVIDGEGTLGFDGIANFRADVFLSSALAAQLLPEMSKAFEKTPQAHLGPIATLISGSLLAPEVKPDPAQAAELTEKIYKGKTKEILYELVLE